MPPFRTEPRGQVLKCDLDLIEHDVKWCEITHVARRLNDEAGQVPILVL